MDKLRSFFEYFGELVKQLFKAESEVAIEIRRFIMEKNLTLTKLLFVNVGSDLVKESLEDET